MVTVSEKKWPLLKRSKLEEDSEGMSFGVFLYEEISDGKYSVKKCILVYKFENRSIISESDL